MLTLQTLLNESPGEVLAKIKDSQEQSEQADIAFVQFWRKRQDFFIKCLHATTLNVQLAREHRQLSQEFARLYSNSMRGSEIILDIPHETTTNKDIPFEESHSSMERLVATIVHIEKGLECFYTIVRGHTSSSLISLMRRQILDLLECCEEIRSAPWRLQNLDRLRDMFNGLEMSVSRRNLAMWRPLQDALASIVRLDREMRILQAGYTEKKQNNKASTRKGVDNLRLLLYLHDRGCAAKDLLHEAESAQAHVEYAAAQCTSPELSKLVSKVGHVELERRRQQLLQRWCAAESAMGALMSQSGNPASAVGNYFCAIEQNNQIISGSVQHMALDWPELRESDAEPLYHSNSHFVGHFATPSKFSEHVGEGDRDFDVSAFVKLLMDDDACQNINPLLPVNVHKLFKPRERKAPVSRLQPSQERPPWNPSVLVHDPIRTRGSPPPAEDVQNDTYIRQTKQIHPPLPPRATVSKETAKARIDTILLYPKHDSPLIELDAPHEYESKE